MNHDHGQHAQEALRAYVERGRAVLRLLRRSKFEKADEAFRRRSAAFHNFRVVDRLALDAGQDLKELETVREMHRECEEIAVEIEQLLSQGRLESEAELEKISSARSNLKKVRAGYGSKRSSGFLQTV